LKQKLHLSTRQLKVKCKLLILCTLIVIFSLNAIQISGTPKEFIGQYNITAYIDGPFSGEATISRDSTASSITTFFGTFSLKHVTHYSDVRLSHTSQGYVSVSNWNSYIDDGGNLVKSESTWSFHVSGYQETTTTMAFEYGNYIVLENSESIYEESYTQRYYEDGSFQESVECRDILQLETVESKTTDAGTFECARIRTRYYENDFLGGYSLTWVTEEGTLIHTQSYDEYGSILMDISLISESEPIDPMFIGLILVSIVVVGGLIAFFIIRRRRSPSSSSFQSMTRPSINYTKSCPQCGTPSRPLSRFCESCGADLGN